MRVASAWRQSMLLESISGPLKEPVRHANLLLGQILGLLDQSRNEIEIGDAVGHAPVGEEVECPDRGPDRRRLPLGLASDHPMPLLDVVPLDRLELKAGNVDENVPVLHPLADQVADALLVEPKLRQPRRRRHVHGLQRRLIDPAGNPQTLALLEPAHRRLELSVEAVGLVGSGSVADRRS